ncbi:MAG: 4Fe-4S binding protein [Treponema sp.]|nr:4Fe-4S binding protein [Treponema sp.]
MILKILILIFLLVLISLLLYFLLRIFIPAVINQTGINDDVILSRFEYKFEKLSNRNYASEVKARAFIDSVGNFDEKKWFSEKYFSAQNCATINDCLEEDESSRYACIGRGDCISVCPQEAIYILNGKVSVSDLCIGCGKCLPFCPKGLIKLVDTATLKPVDEKTFVSREKISWKPKIGFKLWRTCYKILRKK